MIQIPDHVEHLGFFGDVHGEYMNILRMQEIGPSGTMWFCVGDAVDMDVAAPTNQPAVRLIRKLEAVCVRGNHEQFIIDARLKEHDQETGVFLRSLPDRLHIKFGDALLQLCHHVPGDEMGSAVRRKKLRPHHPDTREAYLDAFRVQGEGIYVVGHIQGPFDIVEKGIRVIIPGSLGGKGKKPPCFALMNRKGHVDFKQLAREVT